MGSKHTRKRGLALAFGVLPRLCPFGQGRVLCCPGLSRWPAGWPARQIGGGADQDLACTPRLAVRKKKNPTQWKLGGRRGTAVTRAAASRTELTQHTTGCGCFLLKPCLFGHAEASTPRPVVPRRPAARGGLDGSKGPQLRFIHIHQLFRIQYTCFELDTLLYILVGGYV